MELTAGAAPDMQYLLWLQDFRNRIADAWTPFMEFVSMFATTYLILFAVFVIVVAFTRYISLGSTVAAALYPVFLVPFFRGLFGGAYPPVYIVLFGFFIPAVIILKHIPNIKRITRGEESKFSFRCAQKGAASGESEGTDDKR